MNLQVLTFAILILLTAKATGQARVDEHFRQLLKQAGVEFLEPVEARYKPAHVKKNPFQNYDYAIRSRKEGIEIRYLIRPYRQDSPVADAPHVEAARLVMHLATNDQDFLIAGREVAPEALSGFFNADWGMQYFFRPKTGFADWKHCELLALHKDGQGTAFVLFLFDEPSRELGNRFYALRFRENGIEKPGG
ncbi:MAG: hypothetical protein H6560_00905 [Lewinellaceae bacterium]|nr:hypothetical protein [Lewinellaceae bacterium]